jgi:putative thioredoxin
LDALAGLAKCYVKTGDLERAEQTLALAPPDKTDSPSIAAVRSALDLARKSDEAGDVDALRAKAAQAPEDLQAQFDLALALNANGDREGALDTLLALVAKNRSWNEEAARKQLVQFFEVWGPADPATTSGRQRLSSLLFA